MIATGYCCNCNDEVEADIHFVKRLAKGHYLSPRFEYKAIELVCRECGNTAYNSDIQYFNYSQETIATRDRPSRIIAKWYDISYPLDGVEIEEE